MSNAKDDDIQEIPATTPNFKTGYAKKLHELFPEAIADGKVDVKKIQELIDGDAGDTSERFGLFWPGKKRAMQAAQEPTTATLKPAEEESKDWDTTQNIFIEGDNLEALKILQKHYYNKIKMIYIDPPYNTGKDFVYPDNYKEGLSSYLEFTKQVDQEGRKIKTNADTEGRYHSNWLNMMYPRLKLARNLLADDGTIFISIDDHEHDNLKKICSEIFGEDSFVGTIAWKKTSGDNTPSFAFTHDHILIFNRKNSNIPRVNLNDEQRKQYSNPDNDPKGDWAESDYRSKWNKNERQNLYYPITNPNTGEKIYPDTFSKTLRVWGCSEETHAQNMKDGLIWWGKDGKAKEPKKKRYLGEHKGANTRSVWLDAGTNDDATRELKALFSDTPDIFDTPKPTKLIKKMLNIYGDDALVLDFFSGSGTTADAVMQMNAEDNGARTHIQIQLPEPTYTIKNGKKTAIKESRAAFEAGYYSISDIAKERLRRAGEKIKADYRDEITERERPLDVGFKVFKLADTNFRKWQSDYTSDPDVLNQRLNLATENVGDDSSEADILTEILLKLGLSLTVDIKEEDIDGLQVWNVSDSAVIAYLGGNKPTLEQIRKIAAKEGITKLVLLDKSFEGSDELKTNTSQICKSNNIDLWTV